MSDAGYVPVELETLLDWQPGKSGAVVVLHVENGIELEPISDFTAEHQHIPIIVVTPELDVPEFASAVRAGAITAIGEAEPIEAVPAAVQSALAGRSLVPPHILRALAKRIAAGFGEAVTVSDESVSWIRALAEGSTVAKLAAGAGYSEREMFRNLGDLYEQIGARNRTEAILWASRHGLLDEAPDD